MKIYWDEDEYYPWYTFSDIKGEYGADDGPFDIDKKEWKQYVKAFSKFFELHNRLIKKTEDKEEL